MKHHILKNEIPEDQDEFHWSDKDIYDWSSIFRTSICYQFM